MPPRRKIPSSIQAQVRQRAKDLCEYCHTSEKWQYVRFTIDHVIPLRMGGNDDIDNLALACFHCNRRKYLAILAPDPLTSLVVSLFHPCQDVWKEHFIWSPDRCHLIGLTPVGRATITLLELNRPRIVEIRMADVLVYRHPPSSDPIQVGE